MLLRNTVFSPFHLNQSPTSGLVAWFDSNLPSVLLESGTEADIRRVQSLPNLAYASSRYPGLGGTLQQTTSASRPVNATFPEGRASFFDGAVSSYDASPAATNWKFLHDGTGSTVFAVFRTPNVSAAAQTIYATTNVNASLVGTVVRTLTNGGLRINLSDGTSLDDYNSTTGVVQPNTTHVACVRHRSSGTSVINARLDGSQVLDVASYTTITPSSADPANPFKVGRRPGGADPFFGWIPEVIVFNTWLSDLEVAAVEAYLSGKWVLQLHYLDFGFTGPLWNLARLYESNGSAWFERMLSTFPTVNSAPTHAIEPDYDNRNVATLDGIDDFFADDSVASLFEGNDAPMTLFVVGDGAANDFFCGFGAEGDDNPRATIASGASWFFNRRDDAGTSGTVTLDTFNADTPTRVAAAWGGDLADGYINGVRTDQDVALATGTISFDTFRMGSVRANGVNVAPLAGRLASVMLFQQRLNAGDVLAIDYALKEWFDL